MIAKYLTSKKFFYSLIFLFIVFGVYFSLSIAYGIPSDEKYHFRFIEFYANRSISNGPIISDQGLGYFDLRDIQRVPSYLYHYSLGFVLKFIRFLSHDLFVQITILRLINVGIGVVALVHIRKLLSKISKSDLVVNVSIAMLVLTGMFSWTFASVSYDPLGILLFIIILNICVDLLKQGLRVKKLMLLALLSLILVLVKVAFAPFTLTSILILAILMRKDILALKIKNDVQLKKISSVILIVAILLLGGLFVERYVFNLEKYGSVEPACDQIHSVEHCLQNDVFYRNYYRKIEYSKEKSMGLAVKFSPVSYTTNWVKSMYSRLAFYYGHEQMSVNSGGVAVFWLSSAFVLACGVFVRRKLVSSKEEAFLYLVLASYVLILFVFNLRTYIRAGLPYALQGRYLLPVLPILFFAVSKVVLLAYQKLQAGYQKGFLAILGILVVLGVYMHFPLLVFYRGTEAKWYTQQTSGFNLGTQKMLEKINIKTII